MYGYLFRLLSKIHHCNHYPDSTYSDILTNRIMTAIAEVKLPDNQEVKFTGKSNFREVKFPGKLNFPGCQISQELDQTNHLAASRKLDFPDIRLPGNLISREIRLLGNLTSREI